MLVGLIPILLFSYLLYFLASAKKRHLIWSSIITKLSLIGLHTPLDLFQVVGAANPSLRKLNSTLKLGPLLEKHPSDTKGAWPLALISYTLNSTLCLPLPAKVPCVH